MEEKQIETDKQWEYFIEAHREYRKSGIGLSATFIALSGLLIKQLLSAKLVEATSGIAWSIFMCKIILILTIVSAIAIQVFNYFGEKYYASVHNENLLIDRCNLTGEPKAKVDERIAWLFTKITVCHGLATVAVYIAIGSFILGAILWIVINPNFF